MTTIRYIFRPSLFHQERTLILDDRGLTLREGDGGERRVALDDIVSLHVEPATAGDDGKPRWLINLGVRDGKPIQIDSVYVHGASDFEHKIDEFATVLEALHKTLGPRGDAVRYSVGTRRGVLIAWRVAFFLCVVAGLVGAAAAVVTGEFEVLFGAASFIGLGILGLLMLRGRSGPRAYRPTKVQKAP
jgi:hypothetical protein